MSKRITRDAEGERGLAIVRRNLLAASAGWGAGALLAPASAQAQAAACVEDTWDKIKRTGVFDLGAREATPPYGYKDRGGNWVGFSTEIAQAIHANLQKEMGGAIRLNYVPVTSQTRIPLLQNGTVDMEAGATTVTQARCKVVEFGVAPFVSSTALIVAADGPIRKVEDLGGKRVGVPQGGVGGAIVRGLNEKGRIRPAATVIGFPDHPQAFTALETGAIDTYAVEGPILEGLRAKSTTPNRWRVFDAGIDSYLQAFPFRPGSPKFRRVVDLTIVGMFNGGEWEKLYDKYFGPKADAPFPMTDTLRWMAVLNAWPEQ